MMIHHTSINLNYIELCLYCGMRQLSQTKSSMITCVCGFVPSYNSPTGLHPRQLELCLLRPGLRVLASCSVWPQACRPACQSTIVVTRNADRTWNQHALVRRSGSPRCPATSCPAGGSAAASGQAGGQALECIESRLYNEQHHIGISTVSHCVS
jgi:hypothetical protein